MVVVDGGGVPLEVRLYSASPSEVRLAEETLAAIRVGRRHRGGRPRQKPARVIADKGYDSDALRERDRKSTRLNSSHLVISYAVFCLKKKNSTIINKDISDCIY